MIWGRQVFAQSQKTRVRVVLPERVVTVVRVLPLEFVVRVMLPLAVLVRLEMLVLPLLPVRIVVRVAIVVPHIRCPDRQGDGTARPTCEQWPARIGFYTASAHTSKEIEDRLNVASSKSNRPLSGDYRATSPKPRLAAHGRQETFSQAVNWLATLVKLSAEIGQLSWQ
jgi:hypothetical protein